MAPAAVGTYIHQGCWSDSGERTLTGYIFANSTGMTVEMCIGACAQRGFQYGGAEYGQEVSLILHLFHRHYQFKDAGC